MSHKRSCPEYEYLEEVFKPNAFLLPEFSISSETFEGESNIDGSVDVDSGGEEDSDGEAVGGPDVTR